MTSPAALVEDLLRDHPVLDGHNDLLWAARERTGYDFGRLDLRSTETCRRLGTHTDLPRLRAGGVGAQFWSVFVPATLTGGDAVTATLEQVDAAYRMSEAYAEELALVTTVEGVERAWRQGRVAGLMGAEGGHQIDGSLGTLRMLHRLGVRYLTLTHNANVPWADSATDAPVLGGLSEFGREVVRELNRLGMLVDLSHVSADTMRQALATSRSPAIFSHSSARAVTDHPRNVPDDVLAALAGNGGVCQVTFVPYFVSQACREWEREMDEELAQEGLAEFSLEEDAWVAAYRRRNPPPPVGVADVVAHVEHVREVAGVGHVGLGGDYDGVGWLPEGLEDVSGYPRLLEALAARGWSREELAGLTSRNVLRVMREANLTDGAAAGRE